MNMNDLMVMFMQFGDDEMQMINRINRDKSYQHIDFQKFTLDQAIRITQLYLLLDVNLIQNSEVMQMNQGADQCDIEDEAC
jgi:hypothetical protein